VRSVWCEVIEFGEDFEEPLGEGSEALRRRSLEGRSWEDAAPPLKDPDRVPAPSTLRRWSRSLDCSLPAFSFLRARERALNQTYDFSYPMLLG
jgi:hypothetical protein